MLPTFNLTGDVMLVEHISKHFKSLERGDVIVCMSPSVPGRAVLKRIIGMVGKENNTNSMPILCNLPSTFLTLLFLIQAW
jgi:signal peptidase I